MNGGIEGLRVRLTYIKSDVYNSDIINLFPHNSTELPGVHVSNPWSSLQLFSSLVCIPFVYWFPGSFISVTWQQKVKINTGSMQYYF
jgi:hypothetical protein